MSAWTPKPKSCPSIHDFPSHVSLGAERVIFNGFADGLFYYAVSHQRRTWRHDGRFISIERPKRVEYTCVLEATQGVESIVTVTTTPKGQQAQVTLCLSGVPEDEMGRRHREGWTWVLVMLVEAIAPKT